MKTEQEATKNWWKLRIDWHCEGYYSYPWSLGEANNLQKRKWDLCLVRTLYASNRKFLRCWVWPGINPLQLGFQPYFVTHPCSIPSFIHLLKPQTQKASSASLSIIPKTWFINKCFYFYFLNIYLNHLTLFTSTVAAPDVGLSSHPRAIARAPGTQLSSWTLCSLVSNRLLMKKLT